MSRVHHVLFGSALLACTQLAFAQAAADITIPPQGPPPEGTAIIIPHAPPTDVPPVAPAEPPADTADPAAVPPQTSGGVPAQGASGGLAVGTIVQTQPPTHTPSAAELSNDPFVQRREARAQARREYRERVEAARQEYRQDRRAADALLYQQSGN